MYFPFFSKSPPRTTRKTSYKRRDFPRAIVCFFGPRIHSLMLRPPPPPPPHPSLRPRQIILTKGRHAPSSDAGDLEQDERDWACPCALFPRDYVMLQTASFPKCKAFASPTSGAGSTTRKLASVKTSSMAVAKATPTTSCRWKSASTSVVTPEH